MFIMTLPTKINSYLLIVIIKIINNFSRVIIIVMTIFVVRCSKLIKAILRRVTETLTLLGSFKWLKQGSDMFAVAAGQTERD